MRARPAYNGPVNGHSTRLNPLTPQQLTGRTATHVRDVPHLASRLHTDAIDAVQALVAAAAGDDIDLAIVSSFRDFERQLAIWNAKFSGERALLDAQGQPLVAADLDERARVDA